MANLTLKFVESKGSYVKYATPDGRMVWFTKAMFADGQAPASVGPFDITGLAAPKAPKITDPVLLKAAAEKAQLQANKKLARAKELADQLAALTAPADETPAENVPAEEQAPAPVAAGPNGGGKLNKGKK